jgi:hypothetical protein
MPDTIDTYRTDTNLLLGSAVSLLQSLVDRPQREIPRDMAREWLAAYERYRRGGRAALPWITFAD